MKISEERNKKIERKGEKTRFPIIVILETDIPQTERNGSEASVATA